MTNYATDLSQFAKQIVWFMPPEKALEDMNYFLVHLMAKSTDGAYHHFREQFPEFSDCYFIDALHNAKPGIFMFENDWIAWNDKFGLNPPLPFPRKYS